MIVRSCSLYNLRKIMPVKRFRSWTPCRRWQKRTNTGQVRLSAIIEKVHVNFLLAVLNSSRILSLSMRYIVVCGISKKWLFLTTGIWLSYRSASLCSLAGPIRPSYARVNFIRPVKDYEFGCRKEGPVTSVWPPIVHHLFIVDNTLY